MSTIHNPSNFAPEDYDVQDYLDNRRPEYYLGETVEQYQQVVRAWEADMQSALGSDWRAKIHRCAHCGNGNVRWITAVLHVPTGERIVFGSDCTKRLGFRDRVAFKLAQVQARAEARQIRFTIYNKRAAYLQAHPEIAHALQVINQPAHAKNHFVRDVLDKLDKYGELSDRQAAAVVNSLKRDEEYAARQAAESLEPKGDAPEGRVEVEGQVLSVKEVESDFGVTVKMLVKLANNSKVWLTVPRSSDVERNDTVKVKATFTRSKDDASFAFGKRPTMIELRKAGA